MTISWIAKKDEGKIRTAVNSGLLASCDRKPPSPECDGPDAGFCLCWRIKSAADGALDFDPSGSMPRVDGIDSLRSIFQCSQFGEFVRLRNNDVPGRHRPKASCRWSSPLYSRSRSHSALTISDYLLGRIDQDNLEILLF